MTEYFQIGIISKPHGLHGEVNVFPTTDDPARFKKLKKVIMESGRDGRIELNVQSVKFFKKFVIVKFKEFNTIEDVEKLRGKELIIPRSDAQKLGKNEYYASDLIGLTICDEEGNELGVLKEVISTGANDVYEMQREGEEETILIPAISDCIKNVDIENGLITIHVMDGLL
ncbi:MAG: ribosome maturation factor RimM [Butyrivibrio sp.]|jgi:16S rRNA processing protein RimM|nr:ribosome maturation factor RimM [Butyrivibrio sp.]MBQ7428293.1 ribosome maturation factor RimM [Butyrivibrio sp.]